MDLMFQPDCNIFPTQIQPIVIHHTTQCVPFSVSISIAYSNKRRFTINFSSSCKLYKLHRNVETTIKHTVVLRKDRRLNLMKENSPCLRNWEIFQTYKYCPRYYLFLVFIWLKRKMFKKINYTCSVF